MSLRTVSRTYPWLGLLAALLIGGCGEEDASIVGVPSDGEKGAYTSRLYMNEVLYKGQYLISPSGVAQLVYQSDGNLVLYANPGRAIWSSNTQGRASTHLVMQGDGNLVLYNGGTPVWHIAKQAGWGCFLQVQDDGNLVVYTPGGAPVWYTATNLSTLYVNQYLTPGQRLWSPSLQYRFDYQSDGNLVVYQNNVAIWHTGTYGKVSTYLGMQSDGNLVLRNSNTAVWAAMSAGSNCRLVMQNDGNLVIYRGDNSVAWSSRGGTTTPPPSSAVLEVSLYRNPTVMQRNQAFSYTVRVKNTGSATAYNVLAWGNHVYWRRDNFRNLHAFSNIQQAGVGSIAPGQTVQTTLYYQKPNSDAGQPESWDFKLYRDGQVTVTSGANW